MGGSRRTNRGRGRRGHDDDDDGGASFNLHSLCINYNRSCRHSNAIFAYDPDCWRHVHGPRAVVEYLTFGVGVDDDDGGWGGATRPGPPFPIPLHSPPNVFRQANLDAFAGIVGKIRERILRDFGGGGNNDVACMKLYSSVGTISLHVLDLVLSLVCFNENPNNGRCFAD